MFSAINILYYRIYANNKKIVILILFCLNFFTINTFAASDINQQQITAIVDHTIQPLMQKYQLPGMAIAVTIAGKNYFYNYGIASKETRKPITKQTLFEIGSITKTFTAILAAYAAENNKIDLANDASQYLPELRSSSFDHISLLDLGTQTSGLPLLVPDNIKTTAKLMDYLRQWHPHYPIGAQRIYSNIGIGLLGMITTKSLYGTYNDLLQTLILSPLALQHTYLTVPANEMSNYAQGYTERDTPARLQEGVLWREAYGLKTCTADLIRYVDANLQEIPISANLQRAILNTHTAYFKSNYLTQDLVWEQYSYPTTLKQLLIGNGDTYLEPSPVIKINPPLPPQADKWINKTGSTNGFSAYIAFIPVKKIGIVILANKFYPTEQRVVAGYAILSQVLFNHLN